MTTEVQGNVLLRKDQIGYTSAVFFLFVASIESPGFVLLLISCDASDASSPNLSLLTSVL